MNDMTCSVAKNRERFFLSVMLNYMEPASWSEFRWQENEKKNGRKKL